MVIYEAGRIRSWSVESGNHWLYGFYIHDSGGSWRNLYIERKGNKRFRITLEVYIKKSSMLLKKPDIEGLGKIKLGERVTWKI